MLSTFVNVSSAERLKAMRSKSLAATWFSTLKRGIPSARMAVSMSVHGA